MSAREQGTYTQIPAGEATELPPETMERWLARAELLCQWCGRSFCVDGIGRRESDWVVSSRWCTLLCNAAWGFAHRGGTLEQAMTHDDDVELARCMVRTHADLVAFRVELARRAAIEAKRLADRYSALMEAA